MASCTYTVGDKNASGDNYYAPFLNDEQRKYFWNTYGFHGNKDYWTGGWGWDDDANTDKALARTFNACWVLTYSAVDYQNDGYGTHNILNWARRYVRDKMDDLQAHCGSNPFAIATTFTGLFVDDRTKLYLKFFYGKSVVERSAVLVHESRHYDVGHDANFPPWSVLANAGQGQQADSSWGYNGAYHFEVAYLSWFNNVAPAATPAIRARARQRANWCLDNAFATHPGFTIDENSAPQSGWRWCSKCQSLCFAGFGQIGRCAAGGAHNHSGSWNLPLIHGTYAPGQNGWNTAISAICSRSQIIRSRARVPPARAQRKLGLRDAAGRRHPRHTARLALVRQVPGNRVRPEWWRALSCRWRAPLPIGGLFPSCDYGRRVSPLTKRMALVQQVPGAALRQRRRSLPRRRQAQRAVLELHGVSGCA
jgi:hypothetical protein